MVVDEQAQGSRPSPNLTCEPLISSRWPWITAWVVVCEEDTRGLIEHRDAQDVGWRGAARAPTSATDHGSPDRTEAGVHGQDPELLVPSSGEGSQATHNIFWTRHGRRQPSSLHEGMELKARDQSLSLSRGQSSPGTPPPLVSLSGRLNVLKASEERLSALNAIRGVEHAGER